MNRDNCYMLLVAILSKDEISAEDAMTLYWNGTIKEKKKKELLHTTKAADQNRQNIMQALLNGYTPEEASVIYGININTAYKCAQQISKLF